MKKVLLAIMLMATLVAVPAFAAVQNIKVSGNIDSTFLYRDRFDLRDTNPLGDLTRPQYEQRLFLTQTRLRVDADLSDNVSTTVALINERAWGTEGETSGDTNVDLYLAYATLRQMLYSPLTVTIGRQYFNYGNGFIIGDIGPNNVATGPLGGIAGDLTLRTSTDGIKMVFDYKPLTIDLFAAKIAAKNLAGRTGAHKDDIDLYGLNANYQLGDSMNTTVEGYFFNKVDNSFRSPGGGAAAGQKADTVYTPGLRASTNPIKGLNVQGEVAWQRGNKVVSTAVTGYNEKREAMGAQVITNYQIQCEKVKKWNPMVQGVYTFVSGDSNTGDAPDPFRPRSRNKWTAWDPMFETQSGGKIYNSIFNLTNDHIVELSTQFTPIEDVTAKFTWTGMWLDKRLDGSAGTGLTTLAAGTFVLPDGTGSTWAPRVTSNLDLGWEVDADFGYNYTEDVRLGLNFGWFFPGNAFDTGYQANAKQAMATIGVAF